MNKQTKPPPTTKKQQQTLEAAAVVPFCGRLPYLWLSDLLICFFTPLMDEVGVCTHRRTTQENHEIVCIYKCATAGPVDTINKPSFIFHLMASSLKHLFKSLLLSQVHVNIYVFLSLPIMFLLFPDWTSATGSFVACVAQHSEEVSSDSEVSAPRAGAVLVLGTNANYTIKYRQ